MMSFDIVEVSQLIIVATFLNEVLEVFLLLLEFLKFGMVFVKTGTSHANSVAIFI